MQYHELVEQLRNYGAHPGLPNTDAVALMAGIAIDEEIAETETCEACGYFGLAYESWVNEHGDYMAAVAVCEECFWSMEF